VRDTGLLFSFYFIQARNRLFNPQKEDVIKTLLLFVFLAVFFPMIYHLFSFIFTHFYKVQLIGPFLVNKLLSGFYLTFSVMIVLSSVIAAIPVLYLSRDTDFLFSSPVRTGSVFAVQAVKIAVSATWMILLMAVPVFTAYKMVLNIPVGRLLFILAAHVPLFLIMSAAGIMLTVLLVRFFPAENIRNTAIALSGIFVVIFVVYFRMLQPERITGAGISEVSEFLKNIRTGESLFFPHAAFMNVVVQTTGYGILNALKDFIVFMSAGTLVFGFALAAGGRLYEAGYGNRGAFSKSKKSGIDTGMRRTNMFMAQAGKDFKYLVRDSSQWIQVVFLAGLVVIYLFNLYKLPAELFNLKNIIYFLNIGFIGFVLSAVGARFVLPVVSMEGRGFWIFKSAPVSVKRYLLNKLIIYGTVIIITGQITANISIFLLESDRFINIITVYSVLLITVVIACAGAGFGALFANFNIKNPEDLITGAGGLSYMIVCFIYIAAVLMLEAGVVRDYYLASLRGGAGFSADKYILNFGAAVALGVLISAVSLYAGIKKLEKMDT